MITEQEQQKPAITMALSDKPLQAEPLLTFREAMAYLRVSRSTLYRLMWSGQVPGHKVGGTWRFYASELQSSVRAASPNARATKSANPRRSSAVRDAGTSLTAV